MAQEVDLSILDPVRALADMTAGFRRLFLSLAERLEAGAPRADLGIEEPEEGAALLASELRCVVEDALNPALRRLEKLIEEWTPASDP
jgi:hypothetical protein